MRLGVRIVRVVGIDRRCHIDWYMNGLWWLGRTHQIAALGFHLCPLVRFEGALGDIAQAGIGVAVAAWLIHRGRLFLTLELPLGCDIGTLGVFALFDVIAHAFDIALGLLAVRLGYCLVGAYGQCAAATGAGRV